MVSKTLSVKYETNRLNNFAKTPKVPYIEIR